MDPEKVNEIVAHFIGLFETAVDEARIRYHYLQGARLEKAERPDAEDEAPSTEFESRFELKNYDPEIFYERPTYDAARLDAPEHVHLSRDFRADPASAATTASEEIAYGPTLKAADTLGNAHEAPPDLAWSPYGGPSSVVSHTVETSVVQDDDVVNTTGTPVPPRDLTPVDDALANSLAQATAASPFAQMGASAAASSPAAAAAAVQRAATEAGGGKPAEHARPDEAGEPRQDPARTPQAASPDELARNEHGDAVLTADRIDGTYVNGIRVEIAPGLAEAPPDRGVAPAKPDDGGALPQAGDATIHVDAGANVVGNVASIVSTVTVAPVTAVMGDYHQIDAISQFYASADRDTLGGAIAEVSGAASTTVALNIARFQEREADHPSPGGEKLLDDGFPTSWRVSVVEGDLSFVQWVQQYSFSSDNDTVTITTTGTETTVLTGANVAVNFTSYLGLGEHYDLVIVGGQVLDLNVISQISILYDNDQVEGVSAGSGISLDGSGNLVWNAASIENVGGNDRFEAMPDYIRQAADNIRGGIDALPEELARDQSFEGYSSLHILYITGNLYDINIVQQVSILGDADSVSQVANAVLEEASDAEVTVRTGDNAVINIAEIIDCDSLNQTTYVAGEVYSDAILIQSGIIDGAPDLRPGGGGLANEVIAFIGDDDPRAPVDGGDGGTDPSGDQWSDVMQTVLS
ncbi:hypothetical protein [Sinorhizobium saheli]|uniref:Type I secretion protein n=1 Tax=Sinorhizobium saheli TaxID=36856 RepID=A0A178YSI1_SINSA|nr:hypothetical protein [Sinorhizobium saheli]MQW88177.1 hypothetical protein [Sinorhizobium saheli]OAP50166.1 hypothetical protein ATB98_00840 [Sinorhizobium saheli]